WTISADIDAPDGGGQGVIVTQGGRYSGWGLYLKDGVPTFHYNAVEPYRFTIKADAALTPGVHHLEARFRYDGGAQRGAGGILTLLVDGRTVGEGRIDRTLGVWTSHTEGLDVGLDTGTAVSDDYTVPDSRLTAGLSGVRIRLE